VSERIEELCVIVERVLYPAETVEKANWFIVDTNQGVCKGSMSWRPRAKERLRIKGTWGAYQGKREFRFKEATLDLPTDSRGLLHYVCELASGVGLAMEQMIWEAKGDAWAALEDGEIPRLSGRVYDNFMHAIERAEGDRTKGQAIAELLKAGATINMANAAWERWENETLGVVHADPYRLAELPHYGFTHVDGVIRIYYGITDSDPRRIRAAIIYVLRMLTESGSTLVAWEDAFGECVKKLGGFQELIKASVAEMFEEGTLKGFKSVRSLALASDYRNERAIWEFLNGGAA